MPASPAGDGEAARRGRLDLIRGQDTLAVGEGGAREVVWVTGLSGNAWATMGQLCPSKPRAGAGGVGLRDLGCPH